MGLLSTLKKFKDQRILVVGDLILDRYIWGKVTRISPEAPVPIVDVTGDTYMLGGAANVSSNIVSLGGQATVVGVTGRDRAAEKMKELLSAKGIRFCALEDKRPTTVKTRVIAHSQQVVRFDQENRDKLGGKLLKGIVSHIEEMVAGHDAVLVSDYKKGVVASDIIKAVERASKGRKFIAVDPKVGHFHLYRGASVITPNLMEASLGSGVEIRDEKSLLKAGSTLLRKLGLKAVLITRGEAGMSLFTDDGVVNIPSIARKVYDVTGAGDTVIGAFVMAYASGASMQEAAVIANHAAGIVVGEVGAVAATREKLAESIKTSNLKVQRL
jgi:D-beta-D-heptose 7-phosphate kinase/D-beta-D-heptose 1-phosphate adenosyltransferase